MVVHGIEFPSICISNVVMRVTINSGYYDIFGTTELVSVGSDPRCVENLGDALLQAGVIDRVIDGPVVFQQEALDAFLEGFEASHDLVVVVVFWSDGHCEGDSYVIRCVYVHLRDVHFWEEPHLVVIRGAFGFVFAVAGDVHVV